MSSNEIPDRLGLLLTHTVFISKCNEVNISSNSDLTDVKHLIQNAILCGTDECS